MDLIHTAPGILPLGLCQDRWIVHPSENKSDLKIRRCRMFTACWIRVRIAAPLVVLVLCGAGRALADNKQTAYAIPLEGITIDGRLAGEFPDHF